MLSILRCTARSGLRAVTSGAYGTITSANPSGQMQNGIRLDF